MADEKDVKIASLINSYITKARQEIKKEGVDLVNKAFRLIQSDRQEMCLSDEIYSSAEHYLTARHMSITFTGLGMAIASLRYDELKFWIGPENIQRMGLGNDCPASEFTVKQTKWKLLGCVDGGQDRILRTRFIAPISA